MKVCFPEGSDPRVIEAARELSRTAKYQPVLWRHAKDRRTPDTAGRRRVERIEYREYDDHDALSPYRIALEDIRSGSAQMLFAGLDISKAQLLPLVFQAFKSEIQRKRNFIFSIAYVVWNDDTERRFCMVDPSVVEDPSVGQLAEMIIRALPMAADLLNTQPFACVLSYVSGSDTRLQSKRQRDVIAEVLRRGEHRIARTPLQLDAALDNAILSRKGCTTQVGGRPNLLIFPNLLSANLVYKSMEIFGRNCVRLTGAVLCGLPRGVIGLIPRASRAETIVNAVQSLSILVDLQSRAIHRDSE